MNPQWRNFLLIVILATVGATSGVAETAPIPDLSGVYNHRGIPGFEPLASGPTSLVNLSRREGNVGNNRQLVGDYRNPILKPETAEIVKKFGEMSLNHYTFDQPRNQCWPGGVPFELGNTGMQMLQTPDRIVILYSHDHQVRHIRMNQSHPARVTPSWYGDSVGHYDGDTLVIDTVAIKPGPFAMLDWFGTPQTPALHVVERYRLLDYAQAKEGIDRAFKDNTLPAFNNPPSVNLNDHGKWLQLLFTVDDPTMFTTPWSATVTFGKATQPELKGASAWPEDVCGENPKKYGTEEDVQLPTAKLADF
jgi:hypothetical protein